ncbi:MAG: folate-binding protein [Propionibacteriaceae bacterium]|jgi:folate-binding protein YgfZ|nr:folate-binding protein [Propionibacteriaceae bacterium]
MTTVVIEQGVDRGLIWHCGSPLTEQRSLVASLSPNARDDRPVMVDLSNREVVRLTGADRVNYLNLIGTAKLDSLAPGSSATTYFLDPHGHIIDHLGLVADDDAPVLWGSTEPGRGAELVARLNQWRFRLDVEATVVPDVAVVWSSAPMISIAVRHGVDDTLGGHEIFVPRHQVGTILAEGNPVGVWALSAVRVAAGVPRIGVDTDHRTIPNELGVPSQAVSLDKGCYPGQETVAKVHNVGRIPRRLVRVHLDGSAEPFIDPGAILRDRDGDPIGRLGQMAYHYEMGPIGLGLVNRGVDDSAPAQVDGVAATIESLVSPDAGLHVGSGVGQHQRLK